LDLDGTKLDQAALDAYRVGDFFTAHITAADNFLGEPVGTWPESYFDARVLMFHPLEPGEHLLTFSGTNPVAQINQSVTDRITVVPEPGAISLAATGLAAR
jgi:hypothetical protein